MKIGTENLGMEKHAKKDERKTKEKLEFWYKWNKPFIGRDTWILGQQGYTLKPSKPQPVNYVNYVKYLNWRWNVWVDYKQQNRLKLMNL